LSERLKSSRRARSISRHLPRIARLSEHLLRPERRLKRRTLSLRHRKVRRKPLMRRKPQRTRRSQRMVRWLLLDKMSDSTIELLILEFQQIKLL